MGVIENNILSGARRGVLQNAPANWTLLRNKRLEVLDPNEPPLEYYGREHVIVREVDGCVAVSADGIIFQGFDVLPGFTLVP